MMSVGFLVVMVLALSVGMQEVESKPFGPDKLEENHSVNVRVDGNSERHAVDGSYNLDLVRKDGTRQKITSSGPSVQGTYEYLDAQGKKHQVNYQASPEGGFQIRNPEEAQGLREFPADPQQVLTTGQITASHALALEFHKHTVEKAWRDQELHSRGAAALREKFGGGLINASLHREKDPNSNAVKSTFRKEFRDSQGRLRGFQQAQSIVHAVNTSASGLNGTMPFPMPRGDGLNIADVMDKIKEFHKSLFGAGGGGGMAGGAVLGGENSNNGTGFGPNAPGFPFIPPPVVSTGNDAIALADVQKIGEPRAPSV